jgi:transcriptional regulator GlxA family with amidase domain
MLTSVDGVHCRVWVQKSNMFRDRNFSAPQHFAFALIPEFCMLSMVSAIEPLRLANQIAQAELYTWTIHSADGKAVTASNGMLTEVESNFEAIDGHATVVICAGTTVSQNLDRRVVSWLRKSARRGMSIGALHSGTYLLATAGLLDRYSCTIHWKNLPGFCEDFPEIEPTGNLFAIDRDRFSSAGGTAAIDLMLTLVAEQHGARLATAIAECALHSPIREAWVPQRMSLPARVGARHEKLVRVVKEMEERLEEPLSIGRLAKKCGISVRQVERLFSRYLQLSPKRYLVELRLKKARSLLLQTDMSIVSVAVASGFSSASHFSKCYRSFYGHPPYHERGSPVAQRPEGRRHRLPADASVSSMPTSNNLAPT